MTFEVFTTVSLKIIVLWHLSLCTLVGCYLLLSYSVLKTKALCFSEDLTTIYQTTQHQIPDRTFL